MARPPRVVALDQVPEQEVSRGEKVRFRRRQLGAAAGAVQLGVSHYALPPGARAWPFHFHAANEEAIFVLEGEASLRLGSERVAVKAGDFVALPVGPEHAHQIENVGSATLRYLCISTMIGTDVTVYPDSNKVGVFGGSAPGGAASVRFVAGYHHASAAVDYWDGEPTD